MFCYTGDQSSSCREVKVNVFKQQQLFCKCFLAVFILTDIVIQEGAQGFSKSCDSSLLVVFFKLKGSIDYCCKSDTGRFLIQDVEIPSSYNPYCCTQNRCLHGRSRYLDNTNCFVFCDGL